MKRVVLASLFFAALSADAATFTVTSSADSGPGTLRQAIVNANGNPGADTIDFTVATVTLNPDASLPTIVDPVTITGQLFPGNATISWTGSPGGPFMFSFGPGSSGSILQDVRILAAPARAVSVTTNTISLLRNDIDAEVSVTGDSYDLRLNDLTFLRVSGNGQIGTSGSGNTFSVGLELEARSCYCVGNTFNLSGGTAINVTGNLGQVNPFLFIHLNTITGATTGVRVGPAATGALITDNHISNTTLPIDLNGDGPTPNDPAPDADTGGNTLLNYPVLTTARRTPAELIVEGTLTSAPNTTFAVELFAAPVSSPGTRRSHAIFDVHTDSSGFAAFTRTITQPTPAYPPLPDDNDAMAALTEQNNFPTYATSEVSAPLVVDSAGQLAFNPVAYNVNENGGSVLLTVVRTGGTADEVTVSYTTVNGTAVAPYDYGPTAGTLTFGPGVTSQSIVVPIVLDELGEPAETFMVVLSNPTNGATLGAATATVTIGASAAAAPIPTASTWGLIVLAATLAVIAIRR